MPASGFLRRGFCRAVALPAASLCGWMVFAVPLSAQFAIQDSGTTADLRGIASVGNGTAWASGTHGTVLRTEDGGFLWQGCTTPPGAEQLDFRGIQAFDDQTAIVMSSGKGNLSRVYKTTDGCKTWTLVFTNPDAEGFFDAIRATPEQAVVIGDPVNAQFAIFQSIASHLEVWQRLDGRTADFKLGADRHALPGEALFAASNSTLVGDPARGIAFATGGITGARFAAARWNGPVINGAPSASSFTAELPLAKGETAGAFSFALRGEHGLLHDRAVGVAVGGDYRKPDSKEGTAAWSGDGGFAWKSASGPPRGYRSSVAYDTRTKTWITVGPNGTDVSTDDGRNWRPLLPAKLDDADADKRWNALSLPYVVGPHGRIGRLRNDALKSGR